MSESVGAARAKIRCRGAGSLFIGWLFGTVTLWVVFARAPVGDLAAASAGNLVPIHGTVVTTTTGYFQVSSHPSALRGTPLRIVRTNSPRSVSGLQLCAWLGAGEDSWCTDMRDGYAGSLQPTLFGRRAWPYDKMQNVLLLGLALTVLGWVPGALVLLIDDRVAESV